MGYLIRTNNKPKAPLTKYMGAFMPLRIFTSLTIYCLANGVTKSNVMEQAFNEWLKEKYTPSIEKECIIQIAEKMHNRYKDMSLTQRSLTYSIFCDDLKKEFGIKGLFYSSIQSIIKELDNIHFEK